MIKRLHCLFLISLLGSASMANSEPNAGDVVAKVMSSKDEKLNNKKKAQSEDKIDVLDSSLRQGQENTLKNMVVKLLGHFICLILYQYAAHNKLWAKHPLCSDCLKTTIFGIMFVLYFPKGIEHVVERFSNISKKSSHVSQGENKKVTRKSKALRWISKLVLNMLIMIPIVKRIFPKEEYYNLLLILFHYHLYGLIDKVVKYIAEKLTQSEKGKSKQATQQNKILKSVLEFIAYMLVYLLYGYLIHRWGDKDWSMSLSFDLLVSAYSYDMMSYVVYAISPLTSFREDIKNHPVLWVGCSAWSIVAFFLKLRAAELIFAPINNIDNSQEVWQAQKRRELQAMCIVLFLSLGLDTLLSLLTASSASHWRHEGQKGEDPILPSFKDRFLRSFRFMFSLSVPIPIIFLLSFYVFEVFKLNETNKKIVLFLPCIIAILSYVGIRVYDYWQGQKEDTKVINKKEPVFSQKGESLASTKPLVA